ncbi:glycosyltransferase, exosortase A system-associated [Sphingorhabdus sp. IMCC26285]|uniref:Glycosyltransferase, exosortase A system-associated n=1 Tax=Sphingorhabdus profundilacus TaxID=2509718 RepID=A0A6I4M0T0_9SPHN|nr:TIGR04063 family PEP-CTERM/XrtA system glycosyltransferase [Sphingorhabdus profundilacus]MVZ97844.1 glycosyltransferase, exosortase A system-associated [Sphingorhabdus profundilacus]
MSRILHILDHSLPLHSGYTFRTRAIMKAQAAAGWEVAGITGVRQYQHGQVPDAAQETVEGLTFHRTLGEVSGPSPLREWREIAVLADAIVALHARWPFDLLHAHSPALNGLAAFRAAQRLGLPLVYEIRAFWEDAAVGNGTGSEGSAKYRLTRALENYVVNHADAVAVICEGLKGDLVGRGVPPSKITISPNGVDLELFGSPPPADSALAAQLGLTGKDVIGYIGSFYDYEGLDDLIAAMPLMAHDAHLLLVGGGPMEQALRAQSLASPCADRIHFVGRVSHDEVERYYSLVDLLAYPRKKMRLTDLVTPLKPLEAMAQGRLVVASDVGGHKELIQNDETGILFCAGDPVDLAAAIDKLLANRASWHAMRNRARQFVEKERSWQKNIYRYDPVYHLLIGKKAIARAA